MRESDCVQENEYTCCYFAVIILAVKAMMCGHNGGGDGAGKGGSNQLLSGNGSRDWALPERPESPLEV